MSNMNPIIVVCDNIRSLYNVGAIFRTSDCANIQKLYLCGITGYPKNDPNWFQTKRIEKTALGATKTINWQYRKSTTRTINYLKKQGVKIYALEIDPRAKNYHKIKYQFPCALILGHETKGIDKKILNIVDDIIQIPLYGTKTSLNVEAAYAISIFEMIKHVNK